MIGSRLRTALSILLFLSLTAPFLVTYTWLSYTKHLTKRAIKRRMAEGSHRDALVLLKFSKDEAKDLEWEHSAEFEYQDQMYDVVERITKDDSIFYRCWLDEDETLLNRQLEMLVIRALGDDPEQSDDHIRLVEFMKTLYWQNDSAIKYLTPPLPPLQSSGLAFNYSSISSAPAAPPPEPA